MASHKYKIREICGDWALDIHWGMETITLFFNSRNNADLVKAILEWEDAHPNEAVPYKPALTPPNEWVSVEEGMPKEHDSIFKKLMGPDKWGPGMFERLSDDVIVAVKFADGTRRSGFARTKDGIWAGLPSIGCPVVTHWMPMPEPPDHRLPEGEED